VGREIQHTIIDGDRYEMTLFGATQGYRLFHRLFKMFGPGFGALMDAASETGSIQDVDLSSDVVVSGIRSLTENVREADLDHVIDSLKKCTHVGAGGIENTIPLGGVFELHFSGRIGTMFKWLGWGLQVQYASFFDAFANMKPPSEGAESKAAISPSR